MGSIIGSRNVFLFDWGDTIMKDFPNRRGAMYTWRKVEAVHNAEKTLRELSKVADCYLATNAKDSDKEDIIKALRRVGLQSFFKDVFCYQMIGCFKPSESYFKRVIEILNVPRQNVIMVGDSLENDIMGALDFGIEAILFDPYDKYPDFKGKKISNLLKLIEEVS